MEDPTLLDQSDFQEYRDISQNIDFNTRLVPWILEAQKQEMRHLLGERLYLAMINDWSEGFTEPRFVNLWEGEDVPGEYRFYGLKPVIVYFAYARFLTNQGQVVTRYGVKNLVRDESETQAPLATRTKISEAQNMALALQADVEKYLNDKRETYPEFQPKGGQPNSKNIYHRVNPNRYRKM